MTIFNPDSKAKHDKLWNLNIFNVILIVFKYDFILIPAIKYLLNILGFTLCCKRKFLGHYESGT